jgi:hypothetical protein
VRLILLCSAFLAAGALADFDSRLKDAGPAYGIRLAGTDPDGGAPRVYIAQLRGPSAVAHFAARQGPGAGKLSARGNALKVFS